MQYILKILITALVVTGVSELAKRYSVIAAILASLPLTSILAMTWLYHDTKDAQKIISLSYGIFWAVLPSLVFFAVLPLLLKSGLRFSISMALASLVMFAAYTLYVFALGKFGVKI